MAKKTLDETKEEIEEERKVFREKAWKDNQLDRIEKKVDENAHTVGLINKLFWVAIVAASGAVAAQIWM